MMDEIPKDPKEQEQYALRRLVDAINGFPFPNAQQALAQTLIQGTVMQAMLNAFEAVLLEIVDDPLIVSRAKYAAFWDAANKIKAASTEGPRIQVAGGVNGNGR